MWSYLDSLIISNKRIVFAIRKSQIFLIGLKGHCSWHFPVFRVNGTSGTMRDIENKKKCDALNITYADSKDRNLRLKKS